MLEGCKGMSLQPFFVVGNQMVIVVFLHLYRILIPFCCDGRFYHCDGEAVCLGVALRCPVSLCG